MTTKFSRNSSLVQKPPKVCRKPPVIAGPIPGTNYPRFALVSIYGSWLDHTSYEIHDNIPLAGQLPGPLWQRTWEVGNHVYTFHLNWLEGTNLCDFLCTIQRKTPYEIAQYWSLPNNPISTDPWDSGTMQSTFWDYPRYGVRARATC